MKQKWKPVQHVEISMYEIFYFQDKINAVKDTPEKVWEVVDDFFWEVESQLEVSPGFIKDLQNIDINEDFIPLTDADELFDDEDFESNYATAQDYVNYIYSTSNEKFREDIPFTPRHNF